MRFIRLASILITVAMVFIFGFGYGRWYSTRPAKKTGPQILYYVDPMHPWYKSDRPGVAPDCGMKLEPVYPGGSPPTTPGNWAVGNAQSLTEPQSNVPGSIDVSPEKQQLIGMRYGAAEWSTESQIIRCAARVVPDETRVTHVHSKVEGWIEKATIDFTGQLVQEGQPLLTLYSPELLATQQELLLAMKARDVMRHSSMVEASTNSAALLEASRRRLELWDLSRPQIEEIERTGKPVKSITLYSPASGYVTARNAFPGLRVTPETELYAITDLTHVWVMADVFEADAPQIQPGQTAKISFPGTARVLPAKVTYLQPQMDPVSRTLKVRLDVANPGFQLRPEMFVDVEIVIRGARRLMVPSDAVLDSGETKAVFLDRGAGHFEPRTVETGQRTGDRVEILSGLKAGERIVTSSAFLLDSESQMKSALTDLGGGKHGDAVVRATNGTREQ